MGGSPGEEKAQGKAQAALLQHGVSTGGGDATARWREQPRVKPPLGCTHERVVPLARQVPAGGAATDGGRRNRGAKTLAELARQRVAELEQKVGRQALELDFLRRAFERVKDLRQPNTGCGASAST